MDLFFVVNIIIIQDRMQSVIIMNLTFITGPVKNINFPSTAISKGNASIRIQDITIAILFRIAFLLKYSKFGCSDISVSSTCLFDVITNR